MNNPFVYFGFLLLSTVIISFILFPHFLSCVVDSEEYVFMFFYMFHMFKGPLSL